MVHGIGRYNSYMNYLQTNGPRVRPDPAEIFNKLDTDGSGSVSQAELQSWAQNVSEKTGKTIDTSNALSTYDTDGSGELGQDELMAFMDATSAPLGGMMGAENGQGHDGLFNAIDTDSSGAISQSELESWAQDMADKTGNTIPATGALANYDADGDGQLNMDEFKAFVEANLAQSSAGPMGESRHRHHGHGGVFKTVDEDESGGISQSELDTWAQNMSSATGQSIDTTNAMSTYDTNGDGELSQGEFRSFLEASGIKPPPPPGGLGMMVEGADSSDSSSSSSSSTSASSVISQYDTNGDGVLSSDELQQYLDSKDSSSSTSIAALMQQVLSAYAMNFGNGRSSTMQDALMNMGANGSGSVDFSA